MKNCENLDKETDTLTQTLTEKQRQIVELQALAKKNKKYRDLLGSNDISEVLDRYESLEKSRERMNGKLELLERDIEAQGAEAERLQFPCDVTDDSQNPSGNSTLNEALDKCSLDDDTHDEKDAVK